MNVVLVTFLIGSWPEKAIDLILRNSYIKSGNLSGFRFLYFLRRECSDFSVIHV